LAYKIDLPFYLAWGYELDFKGMFGGLGLSASHGSRMLYL